MTLRFRLTALFSGLFLVAGVILLAITYLLVDGSTSITLFLNRKNGAIIAVKGAADGSPAKLHLGTATAQELAIARQLSGQAAAVHGNDLHELLIQSGFALGITAVLAVVGGWLTAGRVLRPLRTMTASARLISARNLHERLAIPGPADEVKELADTIDDLLARLQAAFEAQRRFVANASHELRTPLTFDRALLEVTLADPAATRQELRSACAELLTSRGHQERLIEALLTLASSERGLETREPFDLALAADRAVATHRTAAASAGVALDVSLHPAPVAGNLDLAERMAANLIDNAIRHNIAGGQVSISTRPMDGRAVLRVTNTGPRVPEGCVDRLFEPFQRLTDSRSTHPDGHGLGLSIVRAIATAHDAVLGVRLRPAGGLDIEIRFPAFDVTFWSATPSGLG
jgi:signal transduction histidine kinase